MTAQYQISSLSGIVLGTVEVSSAKVSIAGMKRLRHEAAKLGMKQFSATAVKAQLVKVIR